MKSQEKPDWQNLSDDELEAFASSSPEFPPLSDEDLETAVAVSASGRIKVPVSIRLDQEILDFYKDDGPGYQTRINDDLLLLVRYYKQHGERRSAELDPTTYSTERANDPSALSR